LTFQFDNEANVNGRLPGRSVPPSLLPELWRDKSRVGIPPSLKPRRGKSAVAQAGVDFLRDMVGQAGDFAVGVHHGGKLLEFT
jgi:hypothetical protein